MANIKQIVLKDAEGNVLGTYDIKDANVPHSSESAVSGGTTLSLVTTGEKYIWNNKPTTVSGLTDTTISSPQMYDRLTYENSKWVNEGSVYIRNGEHLSLANANGLTVLDAYNSGGGYVSMNDGTSNTIILKGSDGTVTCSDVSCSKVFRRDALVPSTTSYSADSMRGTTRFLYSSQGVPHSGTTVAFDSSNTENYSMQLNGSYSGAVANARLSFRTRYGDGSKWSNWLYCTPTYRFNTRIEPNTSVTLYVPVEMRNGTYGDSYFLVLSGNYGTGGLYFLTPNTAVAHTMTITAIKSATSTTISTVSDDWGFKITLGGVAYYATLIRLS